MVYPPEFRQQLVKLVQAGRSPEALGREFELGAETIRRWVRQHERDTGERSDGLTSQQKREFARLRRENRQLKLERDILKKAAAQFARESEALPPKGSAS